MVYSKFKIQMAFLSVAFFSVGVFSAVNEQVSRAPAASECIRHESELARTSILRRTVEAMGGVREFQGTWNLQMMGYNVLAVFQSRPDGFKGRVTGLEAGDDKVGFSNMEVCAANVPGQLTVHILENGQRAKTFHVQKTRGAPLQISQDSQGNAVGFYQFAKISPRVNVSGSQTSGTFR